MGAGSLRDPASACWTHFLRCLTLWKSKTLVVRSNLNLYPTPRHINVNLSYRVGKMQSSPKDDPRETLDEYWRERGINTAPTGVPIEAPEDEYGDNTAHFALAVPPDELEEYVNNSRPASRAKSRGRPLTAPGFGRGHQPRGGPGSATPGSTARGGRPRPVDSPSQGTRRPRSRGTGGGKRSGHATPSSYRGGGGGGERGDDTTRGQMQVAIAGHPFLETPRSQTGGMSMSGSMRRPQSAPMGGGLYGRSVAPTITEEGLWNDIPGYAEAEAEYQARGPAGRPISAASNREMYLQLFFDSICSGIFLLTPMMIHFAENLSIL